MRFGLDLGVQIALRALLAPSILAARWLVPRAPMMSAYEVPAMAASLARVAKVALDEIFFLTEILSAKFVTIRDRTRLGTEVTDALALFEARGWLDTPASYYVAPPPLASVALQASRSIGHDYVHLTFESGYEPHPGEPGRERWLGYGPNRTAHAWVLEHPGGPRPWLVCIHAYRTGFPLTAFLQFPPAWLHRGLGLNILVPVLPLHGPRTVGRRSGEGLFSGEFLDTIHFQAQAVWDVRRLLGWVRARGGSDVGVYGLSLGGTTAALLAGLEPELSCVIAGMPAADLMGLARRHVPGLLLLFAERLGFTWNTVEQLLRVISPLALPARVAHERRFLFGGVADHLVPPEQLCALWHHWDRPRLAWHGGSHASFSFESTVRTLVHEALVATGMVAPARPA
jgi:hypothetical protein